MISKLGGYQKERVKLEEERKKDYNRLLAEVNFRQSEKYFLLLYCGVKMSELCKKKFVENPMNLN